MPLSIKTSVYTQPLQHVRRKGNFYKALAAVTTGLLINGCVNSGVNKQNETIEDKKDVPTYYWDKNDTVSQNILENTKTTGKIIKNTADKASEHTGACIAGLILGLGGAGINGIKKRQLQWLEAEDMAKIEKNNKITEENNKAKKYIENYLKSMPADVKEQLTHDEISLLDNCSEKFALTGNDTALQELITIIQKKCGNEAEAEVVTYKLLARLVKEHKKSDYSVPIGLKTVVYSLKQIQSPYFIDILSKQPILGGQTTENDVTSMDAYISRDERGRYLFNELIEGRSEDIVGDTEKALEVFKKENQTISYTLADVEHRCTCYKLADVEKVVKYLSQLPDDLKYRMIVEDKVFGDKKFAALLLSEVLSEKSQEINNRFKEQALDKYNRLADILLNLAKDPNIRFGVRTKQGSHAGNTYCSLEEWFKGIENGINENYDYITEISIHDKRMPVDCYSSQCNDKKNFNLLGNALTEIETKLKDKKEQYEIKYTADRVQGEMGADYPYHTGDSIVIVPQYDMTLFNDPGYKELQYKCEDVSW